VDFIFFVEEVHNFLLPLLLLGNFVLIEFFEVDCNFCFHVVWREFELVVWFVLVVDEECWEEEKKFRLCEVVIHFLEEVECLLVDLVSGLCPAIEDDAISCESSFFGGDLFCFIIFRL
jgi:hypothetical protein